MGVTRRFAEAASSLPRYADSNGPSGGFGIACAVESLDGGEMHEAVNDAQRTDDACLFEW